MVQHYYKQILFLLDKEYQYLIHNLRYYLYQHDVGDTITVTIYRDGDTHDLELTLGSDGQTL